MAGGLPRPTPPESSQRCLQSLRRQALPFPSLCSSHTSTLLQSQTNNSIFLKTQAHSVACDCHPGLTTLFLTMAQGNQPSSWLRLRPSKPASHVPAPRCRLRQGDTVPTGGTEFQNKAFRFQCLEHSVIPGAACLRVL